MKKRKAAFFAVLLLVILFAVPVMADSMSDILPGAGAARNVFTERDLTQLLELAKQQSPEVPEAGSPEEQGTDAAEEGGQPEQEQQETVKEETVQAEEENTQQEETREEEPVTQAQPVTVTGGSRIVCIDAGHQLHQNSGQEPNGPGSSVMKMKVTSGTRGVSSGVPEYQLTLDVALKLQSVLQARGYTVVMCRTTNDVNISNAERATIANNAGAGAFIRIHADGANSASAAGASTLAPSGTNPYCPQIASASQSLARCVVNGLCAKTGAKNRGVTITDTMTGLNWSQVPVTIVEMGFMTNPTEDMAMQDPSYQQKLAEGMADGIDAYFGN